MNNDSLFTKLRQLWDNNQRLWDERINNEFLVALDAKSGVRIQ
jgi:hypothetical protein